MKKLLVFALTLSLLASMATATIVSPKPTAGYKTFGTTLEAVGKIFIDDYGNVYRKVLNRSASAAVKGYPAFYKATTGESYGVTSYESTAYLEKFAGIWHCDAAYDDAIAAGEYGWVQIAGYAVASVEGTTDIGQDDLLIGDVGGQYLIKGRDALTDLTVSTNEVAATVPGAMANEAFTTNSAGTAEVFMRSIYN